MEETKKQPFEDINKELKKYYKSLVPLMSYINNNKNIQNGNYTFTIQIKKSFPNVMIEEGALKERNWEIDD